MNYRKMNNKNILIYVLKCEENKYYVGRTEKKDHNERVI